MFDWSQIETSIPKEVLERDVADMEKNGYIILKDLIDKETIGKIKKELIRLCEYNGRNTFEGLKTQRAFSILAKTRVCDFLVEHPRILPLVRYFLLSNPLISTTQAINIFPGEKPQLLHYDEAFVPIPRPHRAYGTSTIWAIDDFTETNGATVVLPGSHKLEDRVSYANEEIKKKLKPVIMSAGSVVFFFSTLWHGGGSNTSNSPRMAFTSQYCEAWLRPQENTSLSMPKKIVKTLSPAMQAMLGYSIHPPFVGHVNGMSPVRLLHQDNTDED